MNIMLCINPICKDILVTIFGTIIACIFSYIITLLVTKHQESMRIQDSFNKEKRLALLNYRLIIIKIKNLCLNKTLTTISIDEYIEILEDNVYLAYYIEPHIGVFIKFLKEYKQSINDPNTDTLKETELAAKYFTRCKEIETNNIKCGTLKPTKNDSNDETKESQLECVFDNEIEKINKELSRKNEF